MMRGGNREMRRMMDKMGLDMNEYKMFKKLLLKLIKKKSLFQNLLLLK